MTIIAVEAATVHNSTTHQINVWAQLETYYVPEELCADDIFCPLSVVGGGRCSSAD